MKALALSLALITSSAFADGARLFAAPAAQLTPAQQSWVANVRARPGVNGVAVANIDRNALTGNAITLGINGEDRTYVGGPVKTKVEGIDASWSGTTERGEALFLSREKRSVSGGFQLGNKFYRIETLGEGVTLLVDQGQLPPNPPAPSASGAKR